MLLSTIATSAGDTHEHRLLQLDPIPHNWRQIVGEFSLYRDAISANLGEDQRHDFDECVINVQRVPLRRRLLDHCAYSVDDLAGSGRIPNHAFDGSPCRRQIGGGSREPT